MQKSFTIKWRPQDCYLNKKLENDFQKSLRLKISKHTACIIQRGIMRCPSFHQRPTFLLFQYMRANRISSYIPECSSPPICSKVHKYLGREIIVLLIVAVASLKLLVTLFTRFPWALIPSKLLGFLLTNIHASSAALLGACSGNCYLLVSFCMYRLPGAWGQATCHSVFSSSNTGSGT